MTHEGYSDLSALQTKTRFFKREGARAGASMNTNAFMGFPLIRQDVVRGKDVTARLMGDPPPGRSALDQMNGSRDIPPDPRREKWKSQEAAHECISGKKKRRRRGATHFGVKL